MYLNKNFTIDEKLQTQINQYGYFVVKKFFPRRIIQDINRKVEELILHKSNFYPPRNIIYYKNNKKALKNPNGSLKVGLDENSIDQGYRYFYKLTNGVSYKDPLLKIRDLKKLVFKDKFIDLMTYLFQQKCYFGPLKLATFFKNKLPKNCINFFHTDDLSFNVKKNSRSLKISIPLNVFKKKNTEYMHLPINKKKLTLKKQYFEKDSLSSKLKKKIISPKIELGDILIFDPINFFHSAKKPNNKIRNILYLEFVIDKKKSPNIKIFKKDFMLLSNKQKSFCKNFDVK